jgi:hypothetical protein
MLGNHVGVGRAIYFADFMITVLISSMGIGDIASHSSFASSSPKCENTHRFPTSSRI